MDGFVVGVGGGVERGGSALNSKRFDALPLYDYCPGNAAAIYAYFYVVWGRRVAEGDFVLLDASSHHICPSRYRLQYSTRTNYTVFATSTLVTRFACLHCVPCVKNEQNQALSGATSAFNELALPASIKVGLRKGVMTGVALIDPPNCR